MEKNLGHATAYGYAKSKGYSGTEDEFAELMADYASVGQSAAQSAEQAAASATSASGSAATAASAAQTATSKASDAVTAAGTATTKASEANTSADTASAAATSASTSAQTATTAAATATTKASEASESATTATTAKTDAETARDAAAQSASQAAESARTLTIDATLTQSGQAADAKAVGGKIDNVKDDLHSLNGHVRYENENIIAENDIQTTSGVKIDLVVSSFAVSIDNGASFRFRVNGTNLINKFALYYVGSTNGNVAYNLSPNTNYEFIAPATITGLYIYVGATDVIGSGTLKLVAANVVHNNNSIDKKVSDLENTVIVLDNEVDGIKEDIDSKFKTSKNLFSTWSCGAVNNSDGSIIDRTDNPSGNNVVCLDYIPVEGGKRYTLSWDIDSLSYAANTRYYIQQYDSNKSWLGVGYYIAAFGNTGHVSGVLDYNCAYVVLMGYISTGTDNWQAAIPLKTQFEQGGQSSYDNPLVIKEEYLDSEEIYKKLKSDGYFEENGNEIPAYYETHMEERANRINELAKTCVGTGDAFIFISDEHWTMNEKNSPSLINYIRNNTHINRLFSGGDNADRGSEDYCNALRLAFSGKIYHAIGNHEWFTPTNGHAIYYMADMYNNDQIGNPLEHYYYVDNVQQKIRYIILNAFIREDDSSTVTSGYSEEQLSWLTNTALNVDNGWDVIIITHYIGTTTTGMEGSTAFRNAIDSFNNNSSSGKILAIMEGHGHYDGIFNTAGGIPIIMTTCDKNKPWINDGTDMEPWITADRTSGTTSEQAFDVMVVDRENKYISAIRIGALAMDNYVHYQDNDFEPDGVLAERIVHYEKINIASSIILTPVITGTLTWKSRDTSIATVNNGTVTKVSSGKTIISAVNNNNQGEMWIISAT